MKNLLTEYRKSIPKKPGDIISVIQIDQMIEQIFGSCS